MGGEVRIPGQVRVDDFQDLVACRDYMVKLGADSFDLIGYMHREVCNKEGFTGLLSPLQDAMDELYKHLSDLNWNFFRHWQDFTAAVEKTGHDLDATDGKISGEFEHQGRNVIGNGKVRAI